MRYAPYAEEYLAAANLVDTKRLEYFLYRIFECEEVWMLESDLDWFIDSRGEQFIMPLWPYERYALDCISGDWAALRAQAMSLEDLVNQLLPELDEEDVLLEIMPTQENPGCLIGASQLRAILDGMIGAGEYTLDS